jgi:hypothetical protein
MQTPLETDTTSDALPGVVLGKEFFLRLPPCVNREPVHALEIKIWMQSIKGRANAKLMGRCIVTVLAKCGGRT